MENKFEEQLYNEISYRNIDVKGNLIQAGDSKIIGKTKVKVEEESFDGVKIILKKDDEENIKEIKFVCACGETKSVLLDYTEE